jgi:general secretion pathway protein J
LEKDEDPSGIVGQSDRLSFVMIPPPHLADGRFYRLQVYGEVHDQSNRMVLERRPLEVSEGTLTDERDSHIVSLLDGIETLEVVYFGSDNDKDAPSWRRQWTDTTRPPALVRLRVTFPEGDERLWPDLVIRPMIDAH